MFQTFSLRHVEYLAHAGLWTLVLSAVALVGGSLLGVVVTLARISPIRPIRVCAQVYLFIIQGTPLLVLLFIAYFGVAFAGLDVPPLAAAAAAFSLYAAAFLGDIWRGAIQAVGKGQWEGSAALGLSWWRTFAPGDRTAGAADRGAAHVGICRAVGEKHRARLYHRLCRADPGWANRLELDVPTAQGFPDCGGHVFHHLLYPVAYRAPA